MSILDIRYMADMTLYLSTFGILAVQVGPKLHDYFADEARQTELAFVAFGLHLANYFWSAVAKLTIGPHLWTWALENHTYNSIPNTIVNGTLPIGQFPTLVQFVYDFMKATVIPLNLAIVAFQLFAIICVFRVVMFWPWIWNNVTVLLAVQIDADHR
jgi:hypothetical protein